MKSKIRTSQKLLFFTLLLTFCFLLPSSILNAKTISKIESPNGELVCLVSIKSGKLTYQLKVNRTTVMSNSELGLCFNTSDFKKGLSFVKQEFTKNNSKWKPVYGKSEYVYDIHNQLKLEFADRADKNKIMHIYFRLFNDGLAFRYEIPQQNGFNNVNLTSEKTSFQFAGDYKTWSVPYDIEWANIGPLPISKHDSINLPLTAEVNNELWLSLNEASLFNYSNSFIVSSSNSLIKTFNIDPVPVQLPFKTPWRVIQVAKSAVKLVESDILMNLNEPSKIEDTSWIVPGKCMWDWRCNGAKVGDFVYGINVESFRRYIDFAFENNVKYVMYDAAWMRISKEMPELVKYAANKGVGIILYFERKGATASWKLEDHIKTYAEWGVKGIKYGFLVREPEVKKNGRTYFVERGTEIVKLCARYKMLINFHDNIYHPSGDERTYPNIITREYGWAQQDHKDTYNPVVAVTVPFVNNLTGGLDLNNGFYDLNDLHNRTFVDKKGLNSTVVSETARCLVMWSPLLTLPDHPEAYNAKSDLFDFIKNMPNTWDETIGIQGYPGEYVTVARRKGEEWFVASVNNEASREITLALDFLKNGKYIATIYADAPDTHYITNKEKYVVSSKEVDKKNIEKIIMAPGGGHCMWIKPLK